MSDGPVTRFRRQGKSSVTTETWLYGTRNRFSEQPYATSAQVTTSEGNPTRFLGRWMWDVGSPFETTKVTVELNGAEPRWMRSGFDPKENKWATETRTMLVPADPVRSACEGFVNMNTASAVSTWINSRLMPRPSETNLDAMGATVVNMVKPTNPTVDLLVSIAELVSERKLFSVPGTAGSLPGEYLNYMFGIAPTIEDAKNLRTAIANSEKITRQYIRDSGRRIRRRLDLEPTIESTQLVETGKPVAAIGDLPSGSLAGLGTRTTNTKETTKWSFSGAFTYYLPDEGWPREMALMDRLYGVKPGSALAWELLPFSWLADYKTSIGAALDNLDSWAQDGLVMPYGYLMCHQKRHVEYSWYGGLNSDIGIRSPERITASVITERKIRVQANPFGFGIKPGDLSPRQMSIIAALGLVLGSKK